MVVDSWDHPFNGTVVSTRRFIDALSQEFNFRIFITPETGIQHDERFVTFPLLRVPGANDLMKSMHTPLGIPNQQKIMDALIGCDLLHIQYPFFLAGAAIKAARKLGIPVICSFHVQPENLLRNIKLEYDWSIKWLYRFFLRKFYNQADLVITPSEFAAKLLIENGLKSPVVALSNGIPEHFFHTCRTNHNQGPFHILSVGRLAAEKKQHLIIEAIRQTGLKDRITLTLAGTGPQQRKLERLVARFGIKASIGRISQQHLEQLYASTDLFVHTSEIELEGMSVMEAMACGICVIASDAPSSALSDFIEGENTLFRSGDTLDLAEKLKFWISHRDQLKLQGHKNQEIVTSRAHRHSAQRLAKIYRQTYAMAKTHPELIHD